MPDPRFPILDVALPKKTDLHFPLFCPKPTVRILFYTDDLGVQLNQTSAFGVGILRDWIVNSNPFYANFTIDLVNRHDGGHAAKKLTAALLNGYEQVWFFGVGQCNRTGQPENELTNPEVAALDSWMAAGGGVLVTGDHANAKPSGAAAGLDPLLNLGRAIGKRIPRAGELRAWEGQPSAIPPDNHNTQEPNAAAGPIDTLGPQSDAIPQHLILKRYGLPWTHPWFVRHFEPHPLFCGRSGLINVFPDHMHEGLPTLPSTFGAQWPSSGGYQPKPEIVARGTDKRTGAVYPVVIAYDGDGASVGRIVADATWHHYFNINLWGWTSGAPSFTPDGSPTQVLIANFYQNLAVWLSPVAKRKAMRCSIFWWLYNHSLIREVLTTPIWVLGSQAHDVLGRAASQCTIRELIYLDIFRHLKFDLEPKVRPLPWPPPELILGGILNEYHEAVEKAGEKGRLPERHELQARGARAALELQIESYAAAGKEAQRALQVMEEIKAFRGG